MTNLETIQAVTSLVLTGIAVVGSIYGVRQVREARKARLLGPYFEIDRRLHEQRSDRGLLFARPDDNSEEWKRAFEKVAVTFDVLGALLREDMVYKPMVFKIYYDVVMKCWIRSRDRIERIRDERKSKTYMADFQYLNDAVDEWRKKEGHPMPTIT